MVENRYRRVVPNWPEIREEVNRRLGREYSVNYIQNIWSGLQKSEPIMGVLRNLLGEPEGSANE